MRAAAAAPGPGCGRSEPSSRQPTPHRAAITQPCSSRPRRLHARPIMPEHSPSHTGSPKRHAQTPSSPQKQKETDARRPNVRDAARWGRNWFLSPSGLVSLRKVVKGPANGFFILFRSLFAWGPPSSSEVTAVVAPTRRRHEHTNNVARAQNASMGPTTGACSSTHKKRPLT